MISILFKRDLFNEGPCVHMLKSERERGVVDKYACIYFLSYAF